MPKVQTAEFTAYSNTEKKKNTAKYLVIGRRVTGKIKKAIIRCESQ